MLKFIATTILCILFYPLWAQEVSNVQVQQNGEELKFTFNIEGKEKEYLVSIELAEDGEHFKIFEEFNGRRGKNEFRKELNEQIYLPAGVFRVSSIIMISDIDGNKYKTIKIGNQEWMKENLRVRKYRNGDEILTNFTDSQWKNTFMGAYTNYANTANNNIYGKLYNWYAITDSRGLCPTGWHVPTDKEWTKLEDLLGGSSVAGGKMKDDSSNWKSPNKDASNSCGFTGLPGGYRKNDGTFDGIGLNGCWWSNSISDDWKSSWSRSLYSSYTDCYRSFNDWHSGFSIRCIKD